MTSVNTGVCNERHKSIDKEIEEIKHQQKHNKKTCEQKFSIIEKIMKEDKQDSIGERRAIWNSIVPQKTLFYMLGGIVTFSLLLFSIMQYNISEKNKSIENTMSKILAELQK